MFEMCLGPLSIKLWLIEYESIQLASLHIQGDDTFYFLKDLRVVGLV